MKFKMRNKIIILGLCIVIASVRVLTENIVSVFELQKDSAKDIDQSISVISDVSQSNAAASEELSATSEEINGMADSLKSIVKFFKIE